MRRRWPGRPSGCSFWGLAERCKPHPRTSEASWATVKPTVAAVSSVIAKKTRILLGLTALCFQETLQDPVWCDSYE